MLNIEHFKAYLVLVKSRENWIPLESNLQETALPLNSPYPYQPSCKKTSHENMKSP